MSTSKDTRTLQGINAKLTLKDINDVLGSGILIGSDSKQDKQFIFLPISNTFVVRVKGKLKAKADKGKIPQQNLLDYYNSI